MRNLAGLDFSSECDAAGSVLELYCLPSQVMTKFPKDAAKISKEEEKVRDCGYPIFPAAHCRTRTTNEDR